MRENPEIAGIEYNGRDRTYEEFEKIGNTRLRNL
jgi:hypothetical protein